MEYSNVKVQEFYRIKNVEKNAKSGELRNCYGIILIVRK